MLYGVVIAVIIVVGIISLLLKNELGKFVLIAVVAALAFLLMYLITRWGIMITLAKICGVAVVLIFAVEIILVILASKNSE